MIPLASLRLLLPIVAALAGYAAGCAHTRHVWQAELAAQLATLQAEHSQEKQQQQAAALAQLRQWQARGNQLEKQLIDKQSALQALQRRNAQRIDDVARNDGSRFTGLGPDSLRLYRQLLGYSAELPGAQPLPAGAAAQAAGADGGLPPPDLLAHAADYGAWCGELEQRLLALKQLYARQDKQP
ncbi:hypothetical protein [Chromobacterium paludis]|uniref:Lipoprotein n=1 Tax=Chromobacterium paludis TaxID=2605945 RepID=A0A5C1DKG9_9NEIS|nr:hypothetical protein [Chromobacterium paludis]QEL57110.1 hypothetical protein FYK34_16880 [Chromobacterium paludis]